MNKLFGGILLAIGVLVAGLSGLCSLVLLVESLPMSARDVRDGIPVLLVFGGVPFLIGLGAIWGGLKLIRTDSGAGAGTSFRTGPARGPDDAA